MYHHMYCTSMDMCHPSSLHFWIWIHIQQFYVHPTLLHPCIGINIPSRSNPIRPCNHCLHVNMPMWHVHQPYAMYAHVHARKTPMTCHHKWLCSWFCFGFTMQLSSFSSTIRPTIYFPNTRNVLPITKTLLVFCPWPLSQDSTPLCFICYKHRANIT